MTAKSLKRPLQICRARSTLLCRLFYATLRLDSSTYSLAPLLHFMMFYFSTPPLFAALLGGSSAYSTDSTISTVLVVIFKSPYSGSFSTKLPLTIVLSLKKSLTTFSIKFQARGSGQRSSNSQRPTYGNTTTARVKCSIVVLLGLL